MSRTSILLPVLLLSAMAFSRIAPKAITYDGREVYLNGMNVAWNSIVVSMRKCDWVTCRSAKKKLKT